MAKAPTDEDTESQTHEELGARQNLAELPPAIALGQREGTSEKNAPLNDAHADKREYITGTKRALILGPVTLTYFLFFLDLAVVSTATPAITSQFNSLVDVGWYGGAYQLGSAAFQPLTGKIYRYFSIKAGVISSRPTLM